MEPFNMNGFIEGGGGPELSGNESGWTKYIASPSYYTLEDNYASIVVDGDDANMANYHASRQGYHHSCYNMVRDYQVDDDMTSDASSGPSYQEMMMVSAGGMMSFEGSVEAEEYTSSRNNWFGGEKKAYQRDEDEMIKKGKAAGKASKSDLKGKRTTTNNNKRGKKIFSG